MNYAFISVNEDLDCGLLKSQFIGPVQNYFKGQYEIFSINRPFYKKKFNNTKSINILIPQSLIAYSFFCLLYLPWAIFSACVLKLHLCNNVTLVARGYLSGTIAYYSKKMFGINYVFDPRSLYALESITAGRMSMDSFAYKFWVKTEEKIVKSSQKTICVSLGMEEYYQRNYSVNNTVLVPCYRTNVGGFDKKIDTNEIKIRLNLDFSKKTILYFGSLNQGWNNLDLYADYILNKFDDDVQFLIVSQDYKNIQSGVLGEMNNVFVMSLATLPENIKIEDIFHVSDYGMIIMNRSHDWFTRLSVKFAEYTYYGLPVITNKWVGEAVRLINENELSPSVDLSSDNFELRHATNEEKIIISSWAEQYFSPNNINKYMSI